MKSPTHSNRSRRLTVAAAKWLVLALALAFAAYRLKFRPMPVTVHTVALGEVRGEVMGTGTLEARVKTTISPRIQERLAEVLVDQNDSVSAGQLLARLDDGELKQQVEVASATLAAARATLNRVKTDEARALAVEKQARLEHQRISALLVTKISSEADFDKAMEQLNVAEADVKRSRASIAEAESQVLTAEKNLSYQKERLSFTRIVSPYDGLIVRRDRDPGGVVVPGSSILQMISTNEIWISAWVDETAGAHLAASQTARVVFRSDPRKSYPGAVARLGRETDRETREFLVDVRVPLRFMSWRGGKPGAFVSEQGKVRWRELKLGLRGLESVEVTEGLAPRAVVCKPREPNQSLRDGQRVTVSITAP